MNRFLLLLLLVVAALTGCAKEPHPPVRIGAIVWPGYEPLYLARELGYLARTDAKLVEFTSNSEVMRTLQNGTIDAACLTLDEALQLLSIGADIKVILVMDTSHGADVILAQPGTQSMRELKNRRVGYESAASGAFMLSRALQLAGMSAADIRPVPVEFGKHELVFSQKKVDAIVTFEPARTRLMATGAVQVFDSSQIPGEIVDVLVVRSNVASAKPEQLQRLLGSWFRALGYLKNNQAQAAGIMSVRAGISPEAFIASLQGLRFPDQDENSRMLGGKAPALLAVAQRLAAVMSDSGLIYQIPTAGAMLDGSYLKEGK